MKRPEILAPCGELKSLIAAVNAGANAVYLGGKYFSARAFAQNLSNEEIIEGIKYAHLHNAKVYLTLNTLLKNHEILDALKMIEDLYINGLDAIIIQDMGLLKLISEYYPLLDIHASTQMSIMSREGVRFLKNHNVKRIVPARELSWKEIKALKEENIEIECFIHGSMCYSYSGKCLFSSLAGGRSGNRGRCAGPCRKSYDVLDDKFNYIAKNVYPISMKDMCTINDINRLIDVDVDSFKIEGRMKAAEYSAAVSAIYGKYVDKYINLLKTKNKNNIDKNYIDKNNIAKNNIDKNNININNINIKNININNGNKNKIEKNIIKNNLKISVSKEDLNLLSSLYIRTKLQDGYLNKYNGKDMISISSPSYNQVSEESLKLIANKYSEPKKLPVSINVSVFKDNLITGTISFEDYFCEVTGQKALLAVNKPLSVKDITDKILKLGDSFFECNECNVYTDNQSFVPISAINELRRQLVKELEKKIFPKRELDAEKLKKIEENFKLKANDDSFTDQKLIIGLNSLEQLKAVNKANLSNNYLIDIFSEIFDKKLCDNNDLISKNLFIRLPAIIRDCYLNKIKSRIEFLISNYNISGVYINSIDGLNIAMQYFEKEKCYGDYGLYIFNDYSYEFYEDYIKGYTISLEHNQREINEYYYKNSREMLIYGYIALMYSANCIEKNFVACQKACGNLILQDESKRKFTVISNHNLCYNTIYNNVPLCLFKEVDKMQNIDRLRIDFSFENYDLVLKILSDYKNKIISSGNNNHTLGHYKRGVE